MNDERCPREQREEDINQPPHPDQEPGLSRRKFLTMGAGAGLALATLGVAACVSPTPTTVPTPVPTTSPLTQGSPTAGTVPAAASPTAAATQPDKVPWNEPGYLCNAVVPHPIRVT